MFLPWSGDRVEVVAAVTGRLFSVTFYVVGFCVRGAPLNVVLEWVCQVSGSFVKYGVR